jgi:TolB-like protein/DNA-binding winged helix-turn-helix (wHTH) protein/Tfp pilus assembly protein PilF
LRPKLAHSYWSDVCAKLRLIGLIMAIPTPSKRVRFDVFEADLSSGELRKHGIKIKLHHQPFRVLTVLLEHPGEVVTREELKSKLWPFDTFVDFDVGLNSAVKKLRDALGDSTEIPRYVETLPRRGYRFIGSLGDASSSRGEHAPGVPGRVVVEQSAAASEGVVTEVPAVSGASRRWALWTTAGILAGLLVLLVGFDVGSWREKLLPRATPIHIRSIAVLPLENLSGDPAQEYFTDGMTDALVTELAQISSLRVISRTSVMRYKGTRKPLPDIAKELNVDGIVEGSVVQSAERVRVNAQLIEAATDRHLWASMYERSPGDVVILQSEVARAITSAIQVQLTPQEEAQLTRVQPVDPQAYEAYLRGRYFWNKRTDAAVRKSIDYFQQAIQRDPNYALAYAGMAEAYIVRDDVSPEEQFSKAKATAKMALQMDDSLAEAHNAMAMSLFFYDWDWPGAEREFKRALALNPNYAQAHQWYGQYLRAMGWQNSAMAEIKRAQELDPLGLVIGGGSGQYGTQYDLMIESNRRKLELDPDFAGAHLGLGRAFALKGMYQDAVAEIQKGVNLSGGAPAYLGHLGYTYGVWGKRNEARKILLQLNQLSKRRYVSPYAIALVYVGLDEKDLAFDWLQKAVTDRSIPPATLRMEEELASLRSDPRYALLVSQVGLPQ